MAESKLVQFENSNYNVCCIISSLAAAIVESGGCLVMVGSPVSGIVHGLLGS